MALGAMGWRALSEPPEEELESFVPQKRRFAWQIDPEKCARCGLCATACVRTPSAVKAMNDQTKCSNCVVCYGHITETKIDSDKIDAEGPRTCPVDAVKRRNFCGGVDGMFVYEQDPSLCFACGRCVDRCNTHGSESMFLLIRPDLCLGCNECSIAKVCPEKAVERVPREAVDDLLDRYGLDGMEFGEGDWL